MFNDKLKKLRTDKGLTQADVAKAIGVSNATIGNYEQGTREPRNNEIWKKLADFFDVPIDFLMDKNDVKIISDSKYINALIEENKILRLENNLLKEKLNCIKMIIYDDES